MKLIRRLSCIFLIWATKDKKVHEALLSTALFYYNNDSLKNYYLNKYLNTPNPKHEKYAESVLSENLMNELEDNSKDILLIGKYKHLEKNIFGYHNKLIHADEKHSEFVTETTDFLTEYFPNKKVMDVEKIKNNNFNLYFKYVDAANIATLTAVGQEEELEVKVRKKTTTTNKNKIEPERVCL